MKYHRERRLAPPLDPSRNRAAVSETPINQHQPVFTLIDQAMRQRIEAGTEVNGRFVHTASLSDALSLAAATPASLVLISPNTLSGQNARMVGRLAAISRVVALFNGDDEPGEILELGARGLREAVNLRVCEGWQHLRELLHDELDPLASRIAAIVLPHLQDAAPGTRRFFGAVVRSVRTTRTVKTLSARLGIPPSTLASRFHRAALPSPRVILSSVRLLFAKALLDDLRRSMSSVANELRYSSPQAFGRHVRHMLGVSLTELRRDVTFGGLSSHVVEHVIVRHLSAYRTFDPFASFSGDHTLAPEEPHRRHLVH